MYSKSVFMPLSSFGTDAMDYNWDNDNKNTSFLLHSEALENHKLHLVLVLDQHDNAFQPHPAII